MSGILVVDDEEGILTVLNRILELLMPGYDISTATNGLTAWQQLQQRSFDLLLTDQYMPGMTGLELAQQVRDKLPELPIVLMSGITDGHIEAEAQKLGLVGFLSKPFSVHQLRELLESILIPA
ncbi:MAG: response regulator [Anaerolineales bacterium]|nr:response regulator [Anaerolineales bacterium]